jgi:hypothetical protein
MNAYLDKVGQPFKLLFNNVKGSTDSFFNCRFLVLRHLYQYGSPYVLTEAKTKLIFLNWSPIKSVFLVDIAVKIHCLLHMESSQKLWHLMLEVQTSSQY